MSNDAFMLLLIAGVPAVAITGLALAICATSGRCSRKEEHDLDLACYGAVEGALSDFNPVIDPPPST